ncbi:hypothetical protein RBEAN4_0355 [Rickettsia bellii str. RML An4]|uniref:Uncharacterized protein n=1 Tax=Rickettsia bellii str. RML An4 TaxID=1359193 RepID=A0A0F3Q9Z9_RICBE|nr:hypothetical protein RBEAN4_0355 [Rickettsia bellii str. RML An4]
MSLQNVDKLREQRRIPKFGLPNLEVLKVYINKINYFL